MAEKQDEEPALLLSQSCVMACNATVEHGRVFLNEEKVKPRLGTNVRYDTKIWYLDTGASNHMTGSRAMFTSLTNP